MKNTLAVIIPVFNCEKYIEEAIKSVCAQTLQPDEIIVVDDGSTDQTGEILNKLDVANLRVIKQKNTGVAVARNRGVKESESEVLVFMDADDLWHTQKLEIQLEELVSGEYDLVYTHVIRIPEEKGIFKEKMIDVIPGENITSAASEENVIYKPHLTTSSVMVTRRAFDAVEGFDETFRTAEDQVFYMDIVTNNKVGKVELPLTYKRVVKNSLSMGIETYSDSLRALDSFKEKYPESAIRNFNVIRKARARIYRDLGCELLWQRNTSEALKPLLLSMKSSPSFKALVLIGKYVVLSIFSKKSQIPN